MARFATFSGNQLAAKKLRYALANARKKRLSRITSTIYWVLTGGVWIDTYFWIDSQEWQE